MPPASSGHIRWCLDFPAVEQAATLPELRETGVYFQGWLLHAPQGTQVYLKQGEQVSYFPLSIKRSDVIERVLHEQAEGHQQLHCGFAFHAALHSAEFELGIVSVDFSCVLVQGQVCGEFKVLFGTDNWLFLDNDTNQSVEQHTGRLLLSKETKTDWLNYLQQSQSFCQRLHIPHALLIAPSKEAVFPEHYPYPKAQVTAVEQVLALAPDNFPLVYPVQQLRQTQLRSFRLNDTHWSAFGGKIASVLVAEKLGYDKSALEALFQHDQYHGRQSIGDLGNKMYPPIFTEEFFLTTFFHHKFIKYDNALPNFGRSMVIDNPTAALDKHCLMFASSSGYTMLDYLVRIFRQITFIHTSGSIDEELCQLLQPDVLLSQTNARYVLRSPVFKYRLKLVLQQKLDAMTPDERSAFVTTAASKAATAALPAATILQNYLESAATAE
jgi:hypothetical protein